MTHIQTIIKELTSTVEAIDATETKELADSVLQANRIFLAGAGRSGLMGKAFVMRLMHMGLDAYVVGETVTANLREGDLLIVGSGSGETKTLIPIVEKAATRWNGGRRHDQSDVDVSTISRLSRPTARSSERTNGISGRDGATDGLVVRTDDVVVL